MAQGGTDDSGFEFSKLTAELQELHDSLLHDTKREIRELTSQAMAAVHSRRSRSRTPDLAADETIQWAGMGPASRSRDRAAEGAFPASPLASPELRQRLHSPQRDNTVNHRLYASQRRGHTAFPGARGSGGNGR